MIRALPEDEEQEDESGEEYEEVERPKRHAVSFLRLIGIVAKY